MRASLESALSLFVEVIRPIFILVVPAIWAINSLFMEKVLVGVPGRENAIQALIRHLVDGAARANFSLRAARS